jgi:hypothetical protein
MSTALPADASFYVTQCYRYTPEGLSTRGGPYYISVLSMLSVISGEWPNKLYFITPDYASNELYIARKETQSTTNQLLLLLLTLPPAPPLLLMDSYNHELDIHHQKALRKTLGK